MAHTVLEIKPRKCKRIERGLVAAERRKAASFDGKPNATASQGLQRSPSDFRAYAAQAFNGGADAGANNDGKFCYSFEGPGDGQPSQLAVIWWGKAGEPDLMVIYNESPQPLNVSNLADWSQGDWKILARSWFGDEFDFADVDQWESADNAGPAIEVKGRSVAILISDND